MKNKGLIAIIAIAIIIVIVIALTRGKKQGDAENTANQNTSASTTQKNAEETTIVDPINITVAQLKESIEKTENGIKVSNVKILSNSNNIITISLDVQNENQEERIVQAAVLYYDAKSKKIGENGFAIGNLKPNESKSLESTCYIENTEVNEIKIELKADKIEINNDKDNTEGENRN